MPAFTQDFLIEQKRYPRVREAISEKLSSVETSLAGESIEIEELNILFIAFKQEQELRLYAKKRQDKKYILLKSYAVCASSGTLGPKRKQGDQQVPEGFYTIDRFNPASNFHLSLGINYPNSSDKIKSSYDDPGGDIFIHGSCVTIGCLPMTDDKIKEIYLYAVYAKNSNQSNIPVYLFPFQLTNEKLASYRSHDSFNFWKNLKTGFDLFMESHEELIISINEKGNYIFKTSE